MFWPWGPGLVEERLALAPKRLEWPPDVPLLFVPPLTWAAFIIFLYLLLLFWNHIFTCNRKKTSKIRIEHYFRILGNNVIVLKQNFQNKVQLHLLQRQQNKNVFSGLRNSEIVSENVCCLYCQICSCLLLYWLQNPSFANFARTYVMSTYIID